MILRKPANSAPFCAALEILRAEHALHVRLVGAPIPDAENRIAQQHRQPGELVQVPLRVSTTGCSMFNCPGCTAALNAATSCTPTAGSARMPSTVTSVAPPSSRHTWMFSVITTAFSPPSAV